MRVQSVCGWRCVLSVLRNAVLSLALVGAFGACIDRQLAPLSPCLISVVTDQVSVTNVDSVDVLFMIDNSISMGEEQQALIRELPALVRVLSTGDRDGDGVQDFRPVSLRLGVVSSDLGTPGVMNGPCSAGLGDNGLLQHASNPTGNPALSCPASFPLPFLSFEPQSGSGAAAEAERVANDFACIATLGTEGCGYEQQLESTLKALWPSDNRMFGQDIIGALGQFAGFVADPMTQQGGVGNGAPSGVNASFLRSDPERASLLAIVLVTDEEDCSAWNMQHFLPQHALDPNDPLHAQPPNLRCFHNKANLFPVQRYVDGLKALRPGQENLVVFAAITGVPTTLVDADALSQVDFADESSVRGFYDGILAHPDMTETIDATGTNLNTSCTTNIGGVIQRAYPPRRIVEVARGFGRNGIVQSICQSSFAPAMERIIERIIENLTDVCLPRPLVRNAEGQVDCRVVWDLPRQSSVAPTRCDDPRYANVLSSPPPGRKQVTDAGNVICEVRQLAVVDTPGVGGGSTLAPAPGNGWFYDDFSVETEKCPGLDKQRVSFTQDARAPTGVVVRLECASEVPNLLSFRSDVTVGARVPSLGEGCAVDTDCWVPLRSNESCAAGQAFRTESGGVCFDGAMFCHDGEKRCVQACRAASDCPPAWACDVDGVITPLAETRDHAVCVNPTCGE